MNHWETLERSLLEKKNVIEFSMAEGEWVVIWMDRWLDCGRNCQLSGKLDFVGQEWTFTQYLGIHT